MILSSRADPLFYVNEYFYLKWIFPNRAEAFKSSGNNKRWQFSRFNLWIMDVDATNRNCIVTRLALVYILRIKSARIIITVYKNTRFN